MRDDFLLLNPGPVPLTRAVREAMAEPMVSHRSAEFEAVYERVADGLEYVFTQSTPTESVTAAGGQPLVLNGTATMAMEAAIANLVDADSEVVALVNGKFGRRFARIADRYCSVTRIDADWGGSLDVAEAASTITDETDLVTMVHNETSTGLLNPVAAVGEIAAEHDAHFVVDGVTSLGGDEFRIDEWRVDVAITDAQKALAAPPGISALYATDSVIEAFHGDKAPFYEDLEWHIRKSQDDQTPFTSAVPLFRAMAVAVEDIVAEGMADRIARHRRQAAAFRDGFRAMGLSLFPDPVDKTEYSNTVTAVSLPPSIAGDPAAFFSGVTDRGVSISGGQGHLGGEIFRVSNMGGLADAEILRGIRTIGEAFQDTGVEADIDAATETARGALRA